MHLQRLYGSSLFYAPMLAHVSTDLAVLHTDMVLCRYHLGHSAHGLRSNVPDPRLDSTTANTVPLKTKQVPASPGSTVQQHQYRDQPGYELRRSMSYA
eukprot:1795533-Rhodomonas_salina.1